MFCERIQFLTKLEVPADGSKAHVETESKSGSKNEKQADAAWDVEENIENLDEEIPF